MIPGAIRLKVSASGPMPKGKSVMTITKNNNGLIMSSLWRMAMVRSRFNTNIKAWR